MKLHSFKLSLASSGNMENVKNLRSKAQSNIHAHVFLKHKLQMLLWLFPVPPKLRSQSHGDVTSV